MSQQNKPPQQDLYRMYHQASSQEDAGKAQKNAIFEEVWNQRTLFYDQLQTVSNELIDTKKLLEKSTPKDVNPEKK